MKDELWCKLAVNGEEAASQMMDMVDLNGDGAPQRAQPHRSQDPPPPAPSPAEPLPRTPSLKASRLSALNSGVIDFDEFVAAFSG
eukprot:SAG22_NODE_5348_length_1032_cov_0.823151_2_plen_84_part_01